MKYVRELDFPLVDREYGIHRGLRCIWVYGSERVVGEEGREGGMHSILVVRDTQS